MLKHNKLLFGRFVVVEYICHLVLNGLSRYVHTCCFCVYFTDIVVSEEVIRGTRIGSSHYDLQYSTTPLIPTDRITRNVKGNESSKQGK